MLTFTHEIGKGDLRVLAGHENYKYKYNYLAGSKSGFIFPGQTELDNGATATYPATSYEDNMRIESYFTNLNYDFDGRYLLSASYRTDGSSRFEKSVRWGNFYSVGLGWRVKGEKFLENVGWLNELKFRASYGEQGNDNIGLFYPYRAYYYASGTGSLNPATRAVDPGLVWESNSILDIGADFVLFNRISGTVDWFNRKSSNLLFDVPLPTSTGYPSVYQNAGKMSNKGLEIQLASDIVRNSNFLWRIDGNTSLIKNRINKLPENQRLRGIDDGTKHLQEGHDRFEFYLREFAGVDASTGDALYYRDVTDPATGAVTKELTNNINQASYYFTGKTALPKAYGGVSNTFNYRGVDLSVLVTYSIGGYYYDGNYASIMTRGSAGTAWSSDILQRWQKPGDITNVPRIQTAWTNNDGASTRWLVDGSWASIKNITLGYSINDRIANTLKLQTLRFYATVDNAYQFTGKKGSDPQSTINGTADATYFPFRTVTVGAQINLK